MNYRTMIMTKTFTGYSSIENGMDDVNILLPTLRVECFKMFLFVSQCNIEMQETEPNEWETEFCFCLLLTKHYFDGNVSGGVDCPVSRMFPLWNRAEMRNSFVHTNVWIPLLKEKTRCWTVCWESSSRSQHYFREKTERVNVYESQYLLFWFKCTTQFQWKEMGETNTITNTR